MKGGAGGLVGEEPPDGRNNGSTSNVTEQMESAIMKKKRDLTDREHQLKIEKAREIARHHRISVSMMASKGQRPKVSLPRFSWDKEEKSDV